MKTRFLLALLFVMTVFTSCYKETYDNCPPGRWIAFRSVMTKYDAKDVIEHVDLYVYNAQGDLVNQYAYGLSDVKANGGKLLLPFQELGEYTLVAVVNGCDDHYRVTDAGSMNTGRLSVLCDADGTIAQEPCDIYHAYRKVSFDRYSITVEQTDILDLYKNTNNFTVEIVYADGYTPGGVVDMDITATNGTYGYNNALTSDCFRRYLPHSYSAEKNEYYMRTMRFQCHTDMLLNLDLWTSDYTVGYKPVSKADSDPQLLRSHLLNINEFLSGVKDSNGNYLYDTDEKLEQEDYFHIVITLQSGFVISEIRVNNWYAVRPSEEL